MRCDGMMQCRDLSDEISCPTQCSPQEFRCDGKVSTSLHTLFFNLNYHSKQEKVGDKRGKHLLNFLALKFLTASPGWETKSCFISLPPPPKKKKTPKKLNAYSMKYL